MTTKKLHVPYKHCEKIWTQVYKSISNDDNHNTTNVFLCVLDKNLLYDITVRKTKSSLKKQWRENINIRIQWMRFLNA